MMMTVSMCVLMYMVMPLVVMFMHMVMLLMVMFMHMIMSRMVMFMYMIMIFMMVFMLFGMKLFVSVLKIPKNFLLPVIIVLCGIGAIGNSNNVFDTYSMVAFGLMSYLLIKSKIPTVPMILGFILGPMFEENLRRVSQLSSSESLFSHPISCVFIVVTDKQDLLHTAFSPK